jgi:hypothetical protein
VGGSAGGRDESGGAVTAGRAGTGGGTNGAGGTRPRAPFSNKDHCDEPRWLTGASTPVEATDPVVVSNGLDKFLVAYHTSNEVNDTATWGSGALLLDAGVTNSSALVSALGQGSTIHTGQVAMGASGDALWLQDPGILGANRNPSLRRWDEARGRWDEPHGVSGLGAFGIRSVFLNDHDILVVGPVGTDLVSVMFDSANDTWSEPETIANLGATLPNWTVTHVSLTVDASGNAAVAWSNEKSTGARVMRGGVWLGQTVPLTDDPGLEGFWDVTLIAAGAGEFEVLAGPWDRNRGLMLSLWTLGYDPGSKKTTLSEPTEAGRLPLAYLGAGQPLALTRDVDGELTAASTFWTDRPEFWVLRRVGGTWSEPAMLANGNIVLNNDMGMGLKPLAMDSGGHVSAITAQMNEQLSLRRLEKAGSTWTAAVRVDDAAHRFNGRGASILLDREENPVVFWSAAGDAGTNVAWTVCR